MEGLFSPSIFFLIFLSLQMRTKITNKKMARTVALMAMSLRASSSYNELIVTEIVVLRLTLMSVYG